MPSAAPHLGVSPVPGAADRHQRPSPDVEREWVRRLALGDETAFEAIFHTYYNPLCLFAERWLDSSALAEELVGDVLGALWEQRAALRIHTTLPGFLYTAVRNRAIAVLRHDRVVARQHTLVEAGDGCPGMGQRTPEPDAVLANTRLREAIDATLAELPERAREAFLLQRSHGLTYEEIGEAMGIATSTVEKHMMRAIRVLRDRLAGWR